MILACVLRHTRVLVLDHNDFASLGRLASAAVGSGVSAGTGAGGLSPQGRGLVGVVGQHLRMIDFSDKLDEIVCQPGDLVKLLRGLKGLRCVCLASKHVQRYSGTVEEHVEFARERAEREAAGAFNAAACGPAGRSRYPRSESLIEETRRMSLRSPVTDGSRMVISPALFAGAARPASVSGSASGSPRWVTVDLSMIVWQHFLYTGAPYKDHWRTIKMSTLLETAEKNNVDVVMSFRNVEFDPSRDLGSHRHPLPFQLSNPGTRRSGAQRLQSGVFRAEMSTGDWVLRLQHRTIGAEFSVRQRRRFDEAVSQEGCGLTRCRHRRSIGGVCEDCVGEAKV